MFPSPHHQTRRCTRRRLRAAGFVVTATLATSACSSSGVQPESSVRCAPGEIEIGLRNVGDRTAAYTVSVEIDRAGFVETERYSSNDIAPGATDVIDDLRPSEPETCRIVDVEVFER